MIETANGKKFYTEFEQGYQKGMLDAIEECIKIVKLVGADEHSYNEVLCEMECYAKWIKGEEQ